MISTQRQDLNYKAAQTWASADQGTHHREMELWKGRRSLRIRSQHTASVIQSGDWQISKCRAEQGRTVGEVKGALPAAVAVKALFISLLFSSHQHHHHIHITHTHQTGTLLVSYFHDG